MEHLVTYQGFIKELLSPLTSSYRVMWPEYDQARGVEIWYKISTQSSIIFYDSKYVRHLKDILLSNVPLKKLDTRLFSSTQLYKSGFSNLVLADIYKRAYMMFCKVVFRCHFCKSVNLCLSSWTRDLYTNEIKHNNVNE